MKKYSIVTSLFAMLLTACDPTVEEEGSIAASMTEAQLEQAATLMQTVEGQNKFTYATNPSTTVQILDPSGNILTTGTSGSFDLTPGGEESQTFTIRTIKSRWQHHLFSKDFQHHDLRRCRPGMGISLWRWREGLDIRFRGFRRLLG